MLEFFQHSFNTLSHGFIGYIIPFLFVLTIVVFFHELGHFLVARWNGVKVLTFSLGFGPELPASTIAMARAGRFPRSRLAAT